MRKPIKVRKVSFKASSNRIVLILRDEKEKVQKLMNSLQGNDSYMQALAQEYGKQPEKTDPGFFEDVWMEYRWLYRIKIDDNAGESQDDENDKEMTIPAPVRRPSSN
jgi:hypothetical protein